ncbi:olfactory receptor 6Z7-like [Thomomys bottae]
MESFPEPANSTRGQYFVLLGLAARPRLRAALFPVFLALYLLTLLENGLLACLAGAHPELRKPMYFFLANLSCLEMSYVSVTSPTLLLGLRAGPLRVPFAACLAQLFFFITFLCTKCSLLASMAYDRYVAICRPLHYPLLMRPWVCLALAAASWLGALAVAVVRTACMASLSYCGPHVLNHFFCDVSPLLRLSCTRVALVELLDLTSALVILWGSLLVAVASYVAIGRAVLRMPSAAAWRKAFSTCASHLAVLGAFYSVVLLAYSWPGLLKSTDLSKVLSVLYSVITPACSPVVYGLRSREVRAVLRGAREP